MSDFSHTLLASILLSLLLARILWANELQCTPKTTSGIVIFFYIENQTDDFDV